MEASSQDAESDPPQAAELPAEALSIISTEHFALQGARAATISESTGRAGMFLSAVSGGLVALGLIATATKVGSAFYAFGHAARARARDISARGLSRARLQGFLTAAGMVAVVTAVLVVKPNACPSP
jgi:hypothetical protein